MKPGRIVSVLVSAVTVAVIVSVALFLRKAPAQIPSASTSVSAAALTYVGSERCSACHADAAKAWAGSQHAQAMQSANEKTVLGAFAGKPLSHGKSRTRYFRRDGKYWVATEDAAGKPVEHEVTHTFGVFPLQQYLVSLSDGRKQSLGVAWDSRTKNDGGQRWFHVFPGDGTRPGNPQHWAGIDQNWNYQCADCHSTNLRKGYDAATQHFATTWSEMNVACEACHGPGSAHVGWAEQPAATRGVLDNHGLNARLDERKGVNWHVDPQGTATRSKPRSSEREIEVCARCHSRRGQISDDHRAGDPLHDAFRPAVLEPGLYYPDGQQRDEVYTYASFLQSRMHAAGVTCSDCHEPHGGKLRAQGNALCAQCHAPARFEATSHHQHQAGSPGTQCVACHMPTTVYMGVDARHDHSLRIPRPDRRVALGVPDACAHCHAKEGAGWAATAIKRWFPTPRPGHQAFAEAFAAAEAGNPAAEAGLLALLRDRQQSPIVRASALLRLSSQLSPPALAAVSEALDDVDANVRLAAVRALAPAEPARRAYYLAPRLADARRVVRIEAARQLAGAPEAALKPAERTAFAQALTELIAAENFNADRPEAQVALGDLYATRGDSAAAEAAYRIATERDASFVPAWVNWSAFLASAGRAEAALNTLRSGVRHNPESASLHHALGLALTRAGDKAQALTWLGSASRIEPANARFAFVHAVALHDSGDRAGALKVLRTAIERHPHDADLNNALRNYAAGG